MKAKEAFLLVLSEDEPQRFAKACMLFRNEADKRIKLRHGPTRNCIQNVLRELEDWAGKAFTGILEHKHLVLLIQDEGSAIWVRHKILDPAIEEYRKAVRLEILRDSPLPALQALTPKRLDALSGMVLAQIREDLTNLAAETEEKEKL